VAGKTDGLLDLAAELEQADVRPDAICPMAITLGFAIHTLELSGRSPAREALLAKLEAISRPTGDQSAIASCLFHLNMAVCELQDGNPGGMLEHERKAREFARQCGHLRAETLAIIGIAVCMWCLGAPSEAKRMLQALPMSDFEFGPASSYRPFVLAWLLAERGALAEARSHADHLASTLGHACGLPIDEGRGRWVLAEVLRRAGEHASADREIEAALALLGGTTPVDVPGALATKAALKLAQGKPDEALAAAEEGMSRQAAMKMHDHFFRSSFLRLVHIESLLANGRHAEARAALVNARDRLLATAAKIIEAAHQKSFLENVPENRRTLDLAREWLGEGGEAEPRSQGAPAPASPTAAG
jgi:tetratricopeptide (TPR) repeat protein